MAESLPPTTHRLVLEGEYDLNRKHELASLFKPVEGGDSVLVDLSQVTYVDSTALNELAKLRLRCGEGNVTLDGPNKNILRILRLAKLDRLFTIVESEP